MANPTRLVGFHEPAFINKYIVAQNPTAVNLKNAATENPV